MRFLQIARLIALTAMPSAIFAQDFDAGENAYSSGDYKAALEEWQPLAEQGHAWAQYKLGSMYSTGQGVQRDYAEAVRWYRLAAEQGDASGQFGLGVIYFNGRGAPQDYAEAVRWFHLAAKQGLLPAQYNLGVSYAKGEGVPQNYVKAHMWSNIAGANGHDGADSIRDLIAAQMTPHDISEAQRRAGVCMESGYQNCD